MSDDKKDLTRIEDLSEYLHEVDPETEKQFEETQKKIDANSGATNTDFDEEETNQFQEFPGPAATEEASDNSFSSDFEGHDENTEAFDSSDNFDTSSELTEEFNPQTDFETTEEENSIDDNSSFEDNPSFETESTFSEENDTFSEEPTNFDSTQNESEIEEDQTFSSQENLAQAEEEIEEKHQIEESPSLPPTKTEINPPVSEPIAPVIAPAAEKFEDVRSFAQNITYSTIATGGNPPYSIMLKNIRFIEDANEIATILEEFGILNDTSRKDIEQGLKNGALLVSQISEYSAIFLAHKLRRFELDISVGLSEELHPSKSYSSNEVGLVSKQSIYQNHEEEINLEDAPTDYQSILITTTPSLDNFEIIKYIDIASTHSVIDEVELNADGPDDFKEQLPLVYQAMAEDLKKKAMKLKGNAIVGVTYQITPLPLKKYKVSCTGNIVWISRRGDGVEESN